MARKTGVSNRTTLTFTLNNNHGTSSNLPNVRHPVENSISKASRHLQMRLRANPPVHEPTRRGDQGTSQKENACRDKLRQYRSPSLRHASGTPDALPDFAWHPKIGSLAP